MLRTGTDAYSGVLDHRGIRAADDMVVVPLQCGTQWDGLGHVFYETFMWNGYDCREVTSAGAHRLLPEVPTFTELGYPEIEEYTWVGFFAPAGTPPEVVQKLNDAINRVLQMRDVREHLESLTFEPIGGSPQQFTEYVRLEVAKWAVVVKQTGARVD